MRGLFFREPRTTCLQQPLLATSDAAHSLNLSHVAAQRERLKLLLAHVTVAQTLLRAGKQAVKERHRIGYPWLRNMPWNALLCSGEGRIYFNWIYTWGLQVPTQLSFVCVEAPLVSRAHLHQVACALLLLVFNNKRKRAHLIICKHKEILHKICILHV